MSININSCNETCSGCCINNECVTDFNCIVLFFSSTAMLMINLVILFFCGFGIFCNGFYNVIKLVVIKIIGKIKRDNLKNKKKDKDIHEIKSDYIITPHMAETDVRYPAEEMKNLT
jgi:hypothetical protein